MGPNLDTAQTQSQNSAWDRGGLGRGRRGGKNMGGEGGSRDMPGEEGGWSPVGRRGSLRPRDTSRSPLARSPHPKKVDSKNSPKLALKEDNPSLPDPEHV